MKLIVCGNAETGEEYLCLPMRLPSYKFDNAVNRIVQVVRILRYPDQRAIIQHECAVEIPPAGEGLICRLAYLRDATDEELTRHADYAESLKATLGEAVKRARSVDELSILMRHAMGVFAVRKSLTTFNPYDVELDDSC